MTENESHSPPQGRRYFLKGAIGIGVGFALLSIGILNKLIRFFTGPRMTPAQEARILEERRMRHQAVADEMSLRIERLRSDYILVAKLTDLDAKKGRYFIDYDVAPALAFLDKDGLPLLISAQCTHLGCTVGAELDAKGQILCPCHVSLFNIYTGKPTGGPAVAPLPHIGWVLKDAEGHIVASKTPTGTVKGQPAPDKRNTYSVYIAKRIKEEGAA